MNARLLTVASLALLVGSFVWTAESYLEDSGLFNQPGMVRAGDALPEDDGIQTITRGPVHEAFASPVSGEPKPTPVVAKEPPKDINETPPTEKPETAGIQWLPGYFAWDDERSDYLWVSGTWRVPPPDRQWVPSNWSKVDAGWQRVPGFWKSTIEEKTQVVQTPPAPLAEDEGVPPTEDSVWVPGTWVHQGDAGYQWRSGFYVKQQPGWVYTPAHYVWTLAGFIFVEGYWDLILRDRGLLFCPVVIDTRAAAKADFVYQPRYVVHDQCLLGALFVRGVDHSYFFGDYFSKEHRQQGYVSWIDFRVNSRFSDPLFSYYRYHYRTDRTWERELRDLYNNRRRGTVPPPPRTLAEQNRLVQDLRKVDVRASDVKHSIVAAPLKKVDPKAVRIQTLDAAKQADFRKSAEQLRAVSQQREKAVAQLATRGINDRPQELKLNLPKPQAKDAVANAKAPPQPKLPAPTDRLPDRVARKPDIKPEVKGEPKKETPPAQGNKNGAPGDVAKRPDRVETKKEAGPGGDRNGAPGGVAKQPDRAEPKKEATPPGNKNGPPADAGKKPDRVDPKPPQKPDPGAGGRPGQSAPPDRVDTKKEATPPGNKNGPPADVGKKPDRVDPKPPQKPDPGAGGRPGPSAPPGRGVDRTPDPKTPEGRLTGRDRTPPPGSGNDRRPQTPQTPPGRGAQNPPVTRPPETPARPPVTQAPRTPDPRANQVSQVPQGPRTPQVPRDGREATPRVPQTPQRPAVPQTPQVPRNIPQAPRVQPRPQVPVQPRLAPATPTPRAPSVQPSQPSPGGRQFTPPPPQASRPAPQPVRPPSPSTGRRR